MCGLGLGGGNLGNGIEGDIGRGRPMGNGAYKEELACSLLSAIAFCCGFSVLFTLLVCIDFHSCFFFYCLD